MTVSFPFQCPYCGRHATITDSNYSSNSYYFDKNNKNGDLALITDVVVCPNPQCKEYTIKTRLYKAEYSSRWEIVGSPIEQWRLRPNSQAKVFSRDIIPDAILSDYEEACLIRDLSPKASATLSRRCLQGMIRDFHGIIEKRLVDEINKLQGKINQPVWDAIDAVRHIGNVGAHMEQDINIIIDVEPEEAQALITLIEMLFQEWYIQRDETNKRLAHIVQIADAKKQLKNQPPTTK